MAQLKPHRWHSCAGAAPPLLHLPIEGFQRLIIYKSHQRLTHSHDAPSGRAEQGAHTLAAAWSLLRPEMPQLAPKALTWCIYIYLLKKDIKTVGPFQKSFFAAGARVCLSNKASGCRAPDAPCYSGSTCFNPAIQWPNMTSQLAGATPQKSLLYTLMVFRRPIPDRFSGTLTPIQQPRRNTAAASQQHKVHKRTPSINYGS